MELSQRPGGGYFALTAAERRKNGNTYVNGAILAEKKLVIYLQGFGRLSKRSQGIVSGCRMLRCNL